MICNKCNLEKHWTKFYKGRIVCKACLSIESAIWRKANRERHNAKARRWYANNKEKAKANVKNWRGKNPEKYRDIIRRYREKVKANGSINTLPGSQTSIPTGDSDQQSIGHAQKVPGILTDGHLETGILSVHKDRV